MPVADARALAVALLALLGELHARSIVWRYLRPGDIWMCDDGRVLLRGVGAAARVGAHDGLEAPGPFAAPEARVAGPIDGRADLFAAATMLMHAVTGRPIGAPGPLPPALGALVQALAPSAAARFVSAGEMIRVL